MLLFLLGLLADVQGIKSPAQEGEMGVCLDEECTQVLSLEIVPKHTTFLTSPLHHLILANSGGEEEEESSNSANDKEWFFQSTNV